MCSLPTQPVPATRPAVIVRSLATQPVAATRVEKVNPALVVRDKEGKPYSVRYDQVNAMLVNEFLKEHNTVQELQKQVAALSATVKAQAALIQKVSDKLELNRPGPQLAKNNQ
jgi:hypothetical protein